MRGIMVQDIIEKSVIDFRKDGKMNNRKFVRGGVLLPIK